MSYRLSRRARIAPAHSFACKRAASVSTVFSFALLSACGGHSIGSNNALNISASLPPASIDSGYSGAVTASGGTSPYKYSVSSGQMPSGVGLNQTSGNISGTPTASGSFNFSVSVTDAEGNSSQKGLQISVSNNSAGSGGSSGSGSGSGSGQNAANNSPSFSNVQRAGGWGQFGQGPPNFIDCSPSPCDGISFWMNQGVSNPSMSGSATEFNVGGSTPYSDALFNNHLIGPLSSQGTFDPDGTIVPSLYDFTYDVYLYGDNLNLPQALEFDINQFFGGMGFIYGHECRIASGNQWDVWDGGNQRWVPTGVPCHLNSNSWNHITLKVQRTSDNHMTYQSITVNGQTTTLNWTFGHGSASNWYGLTVNYQMDGNSDQDSYNTYLDNLTLSYQ